MFDAHNDLLEEGLEYNNVNYNIIQVLENSLLLCVLTSDANKGDYPLQAYILPAPWMKK